MYTRIKLFAGGLRVSLPNAAVSYICNDLLLKSSFSSGGEVCSDGVVAGYVQGRQASFRLGRGSVLRTQAFLTVAIDSVRHLINSYPPTVSSSSSLDSSLPIRKATLFRFKEEQNDL